MSLLLQVITIESFFPSNLYELNPGMLFTESFIKQYDILEEMKGGIEKGNRNIFQDIFLKKTGNYCFFCLEKSTYPFSQN